MNKIKIKITGGEIYRIKVVSNKPESYRYDPL